MKNILIIFLIAITSGLYAADNERYIQFFKEANEVYEAGNYDSAVTLYSQIVNAGFESPKLFFNLGNSYFKSGQLAAAIYYYERAQVLAPSDSDIKFNLEMANSQITDRIEAVPEPLLNQLMSWFRTMLSPNGWGILTVLAFILGIASLAFYLIGQSTLIKKISFFSAFLLIIMSLFSGYMGHQSKCAVSDEDEAIVFSASLSVKAEPRPSSSDLFVIHEGTKVALLENMGEWSRIALPDGNEGWVPSIEIKTY